MNQGLQSIAAGAVTATANVFMKTRDSSPFFSALLFVVISATMTGHVAAEPPEVERLLHERLAVLEEIESITRRHYKNGTVQFDRVLEASNAVCVARLELAADREERIRIRRILLKNLEELEELRKLQVDEGSTGIEDLLQVRAARLQALIDLTREKEAIREKKE